MHHHLYTVKLSIHNVSIDQSKQIHVHEAPYVTVTELKFNIPIDIKISHFGDVPTNQSLSMVLKKLNLTQQSRINQQTKRHYNTKIPYKLKPHLVALHNLQPGDRSCLF